MSSGTETVSQRPSSSRNVHLLPELVNKHPWEPVTSPTQRTMATEARPHGPARGAQYTPARPQTASPAAELPLPAPKAAWVVAAAPGCLASPGLQEASVNHFSSVPTRHETLTLSTYCVCSRPHAHLRSRVKRARATLTPLTQD